MRPSAHCVSTLLLVSCLTAQVADRPTPGPWPTASKVPPGWVIYNTKNYHVQSQCGPEKAKRLGDHMEIMNIVYRKMFKPDKGGSKQQTIKLFKDNKAFQGYGAPANAAAYYSPGEREMVCYDTGVWSDEKKLEGPTTGAGTKLERLRRVSAHLEEIMKMDVLGCAAHEGWHQYYHWFVVSRVQLPSWINEGMGDYFYTASPKRTDTGKAKSAEMGGINSGRLMVLQAAKRQGALVPLEDFMRMLQQDYYANPSVCYAQGWALCQFLLHGEGGKYSKLIPAYIRGVCNDTNWQSVQAKVFKGIDMVALETEFKAFIDTMKSSVAIAAEGLADDDEEDEEPPPPQPEPKQPPGSGGG